VHRILAATGHRGVCVCSRVWSRAGHGVHGRHTSYCWLCGTGGESMYSVALGLGRHAARVDDPPSFIRAMPPVNVPPGHSTCDH
jgi:hypothetical protein